MFILEDDKLLRVTGGYGQMDIRDFGEIEFESENGVEEFNVDLVALNGLCLEITFDSGDPGFPRWDKALQHFA